MATARRFRPRFVYASIIILVALGGFVLTHRLAIYDWLRLRSYQPSAVIAAFASDDTMTPRARHIYYVNHPQLDSRAAFLPHCPSGTEQTVVLGCYHSNQNGIYLLEVSNVELAGIEQVTAAHETLHAAYDRLSDSKRQQVDALLTDYYQHGLTDQTIKQVIAAYKKSEPHDVVNEMHSIFGTEATNLPPALETYYQQYFTDRSKITGYYTAYEAAFSNRQNQLKQADNQLASWKLQIASQEADLSVKEPTLRSQKADLDAQRSDPVVYNRAVASYNQAVDSYNNELNNLRSLISKYNQLVSDRNAIALEEQQLVQSISGPANAKRL